MQLVIACHMNVASQKYDPKITFSLEYENFCSVQPQLHASHDILSIHMT
jgi:hypothetical protein